MTEELVLTLPNDERFFALARLVVGGFASQRDLPYDLMDDLQLAVETVLPRAADAGATVTLRVEPRDHGIAVLVSPVDTAALASSGSGLESGFGLEKVLAALLTSVEVVTVDGEEWLQLAQSLPTHGPSSE
jgi:hypothetical protein